MAPPTRQPVSTDSWHAMSIIDDLLRCDIDSIIYNKIFDVKYGYIQQQADLESTLIVMLANSSGSQNMVQNRTILSGATADSNTLLPWSLFPTKQFSIQWTFTTQVANQ